MRRAAAPGSPVVIKIGTSSLTGGEPGIEPEAVARVVSNVMTAWEAGHPTVLVTSGAIAAGLPAMGLSDRPGDLPGLQVAAAVGQNRLMAMYTAAFERVGRQVGQVLLTRDVVARRDQYLHARAALNRMLSLGVVPVVNENDTVVVEEVRFGDNDRLAAIVSHLVGAGMLVLLTDTPGIFSGDPWVSETAELLTAVRHTDQVLDQLRVSSSQGRFGSGGVATKVAAARMAAWSGIPTVIAHASEPDVVARAIGGATVGTWVDPRESALSARKLWIAFGSPSEGQVTVDDGAMEALTTAGKSLLPVGVVAVEGVFPGGVAVEVLHQDRLIAKGLTSMSAADIDRVRGEHSSVAGGEVIHRDDLVLLT
ncbi:MAG TPA: glutamate 5-kinase [Acidimicrobiia bacterium]|jgi:glutamate 5-kinase|nr:glutamate 5-kinase [Acidimicrobiia bacterium]